MYKPISKTERTAALQVDLADWLLKNHPNEVALEYGSAVLVSDHHVQVKYGSNYHGFTNFRTGKTGNSIDYLINFLGYNYPDAVRALVDSSSFDGKNPSPQHYEIGMSPALPVTSTRRSLLLPEKATNYRNMYAYLEHRCIPADLITRLVKENILYQSAPHNNVFFITPDKNYYEIRGTNTFADKRCKHSQKCPNYEEINNRWCSRMEICDRYKPNSFHGCRSVRPGLFWYFLSGRPCSKFYVCESAIDAISLYVLHERMGVKNAAAYISIGGARKQGAIDRIKKAGLEMVIATDNDAAGDECRERNKELPTIRPVRKDWNEDLVNSLFYEH